MLEQNGWENRITYVNNSTWTRWLSLSRRTYRLSTTNTRNIDYRRWSQFLERRIQASCLYVPSPLAEAFEVRQKLPEVNCWLLWNALALPPHERSMRPRKVIKNCRVRKWGFYDNRERSSNVAWPWSKAHWIVYCTISIVSSVMRHGHDWTEGSSCVICTAELHQIHHFLICYSIFHARLRV